MTDIVDRMIGRGLDGETAVRAAMAVEDLLDMIEQRRLLDLEYADIRGHRVDIRAADLGLTGSVAVVFDGLASMGRPATASEVARATGQPFSVVIRSLSRHVDLFRTAGSVNSDGVESGAGADLWVIKVSEGGKR